MAKVKSNTADVHVTTHRAGIFSPKMVKLAIGNEAAILSQQQVNKLIELLIKTK